MYKIHNLHIGNIKDCWGTMPTIHACKTPCFIEGGGSLNRSSPNYLYVRKPRHLYLNMVDAREPLFYPTTFEIAHNFIDEFKKENILIHCNAGLSRSASIALTYLAKNNLLPNETYETAWAAYQNQIDGTYSPGRGIQIFLHNHWNQIINKDKNDSYR